MAAEASHPVTRYTCGSCFHVFVRLRGGATPSCPRCGYAAVRPALSHRALWLLATLPFVAMLAFGLWTRFSVHSARTPAPGPATSPALHLR